jgi:hypothetical protein
MASRSEAAHLQWGRRLHTKGVPSYTDEPDRRAIRTSRLDMEVSHG